MKFKDRKEAGRMLAQKLAGYRGADAVVYALPRGGVVVGAEIAQSLRLPLDLVITRKIGHPHNPEYAIGAVSESGELELDENEKKAVGMGWIREEATRQRAEAKRRREAYMKGRTPLSPEGKTAIIVDDGIATGLSISLAVRELKRHNPAKVIIAVPVVPADVAEGLEFAVDELIALEVGRPFLGSVGAYFEKFPQIEDEEVVQLLGKTAHD